MTKKLFFAALAAVVFTVGFTSCNKNDDESANNSFKETYTIGFDHYGIDRGEVSTVMESYRKAMGREHLNGLDSIAFTGKDSADCANQFLKVMKNAEAMLEGKTFDSNPYVRAVNSNGWSMYYKIYGPAENGETRAILNPEGKDNWVYMKDIKVDKGRYSSADYAYSGNLNHGILTDDDVQMFMAPIKTDEVGKTPAISDVIIMDQKESDSNWEPSLTITYKGVEYQLATKLNTNNEIFNINYKTGHALYIYYTTDQSFHRALRLRDFATCWHVKSTFFTTTLYPISTVDFDYYLNTNLNGSQENICDKQFAPMVAYRNGEFIQISNVANLNEGLVASFWSLNKPVYLYLRCIYDKLPE